MSEAALPLSGFLVKAATCRAIRIFWNPRRQPPTHIIIAEWCCHRCFTHGHWTFASLLTAVGGLAFTLAHSPLAQTISDICVFCLGPAILSMQVQLAMCFAIVFAVSYEHTVRTMVKTEASTKMTANTRNGNPEPP